MQATDAFTEIISSHLQHVADNDPLFSQTLKKPNKNINDCITYILNTVKKSGKNGFVDEEIFNMAVHYYDEDDLKPGAAVQAQVVINRTAEAFQNAVGNRVFEKNSPKKKIDKKQVILNQPSLF